MIGEEMVLDRLAVEDGIMMEMAQAEWPLKCDGPAPVSLWLRIHVLSCRIVAALCRCDRAVQALERGKHAWLFQTFQMLRRKR